MATWNLCRKSFLGPTSQAVQQTMPACVGAATTAQPSDQMRPRDSSIKSESHFAFSLVKTTKYWLKTQLQILENRLTTALFCGTGRVMGSITPCALGGTCLSTQFNQKLDERQIFHDLHPWVLFIAVAEVEIKSA
jgi:hypothetical protein